jgi:D-lactate dehydrogenase
MVGATAPIIAVLDERKKTMKAIMFSARSYDRQSMESVNGGRHELHYTDVSLSAETAAMAHGFPAVCGFVNDGFNAQVLDVLANGGTRLVTLRSTGFNNVDLEAAERAGITVMRVGHYSPYSVAEFAVCLIQALNRKIHKAYVRAREDYFLLDGLLGFDLHGKTVGIVGTGKIGQVLATIMNGFGCKLLGHDVQENAACRALGLEYVGLDELLAQADIVSLHAPLTPDTYHLIDARALDLMKPGAIVINTSRGALVDTRALIAALKSGRLGGAGLDVYEEEEGIFFHDRSSQIMLDDVFARLLTFRNVIVTGHQGFFTREALHDIATATIDNISDFEAGIGNANVLTSDGSSRVA